METLPSRKLLLLFNIGGLDWPPCTHFFNFKYFCKRDCLKKKRKDGDTVAYLMELHPLQYDLDYFFLNLENKKDNPSSWLWTLVH